LSKCISDVLEDVILSMAAITWILNAWDSQDRGKALGIRIGVRFIAFDICYNELELTAKTENVPAVDEYLPTGTVCT
jgi:hypothetical protein